MIVTLHNRGLGVSVNMCFTVLLVAVALTPYLNRNLSEISKVVLLAAWFTSASLSGFRFNPDILKWWLIWILYQSFTMLIGHSTLSINAEISRLPTYCIPIMMTYIIRGYGHAKLNRLLYISMIILLYNIVSNVIIGFRHPEIFETLNVVDKNDRDLFTNAGSTSFVSICLFSIPTSLLLFKKIKSKVGKMLCLSNGLLAFLFMVFINSRATALILLIIMVVWLILPVRSHGKSTTNARKNIWIYIGVGIAIYLGTIPMLEFIAQFFMDMNGMAGRLSTRMLDIVQFIQVGGNIDSMGDGSFAKRLLLWLTSWNTFTASPLNFFVGIGEDVHLYDYYSLLQCGVGSHSTILDCLAQYGIIGGFLLFNCFKSSFSYILNLCESYELRARINTVFIIFALYSLLNNSLTMDLFFVVFLMIPLAIIQITDK